MTELRRKSFLDPDDAVRLPLIEEDIVELGGYTVARVVQEPGWVWSRDMAPLVGGGDWCEAHHIGLVVSGRWGAELRDGTKMEFAADDVFDVPPGHDGYTIGDEPCVMYEWSGVRSFVGPRALFRDRVLASLMFTDLRRLDRHGRGDGRCGLAGGAGGTPACDARPAGGVPRP